MHVVFVCSGNICRSPIAEKVFAAELERAGLAEGVRVTSAGTGGWHVGDPAAPERAEVPDPYYGEDAGFDEVLAMIRAAVPGMLDWVRENK